MANRQYTLSSDSSSRRFVRSDVLIGGAERMVWASDYPHWDYPYDTMLTRVTECAELTDDQKRLILGENDLRLYPRVGRYATIMV